MPCGPCRVASALEASNGAGCQSSAWSLKAAFRYKELVAKMFCFWEVIFFGGLWIESGGKGLDRPEPTELPLFY